MLAPLLLWLVALPQPEMNVAYGKAKDVTLLMDIYRPEPAGESSPAVVVIHGGAWMAGERKDMAELSKRIAANGMLAANVFYRLAPVHQWPAMLDDVQTAVRFLRANAAKYRIDPYRIGATGASAGGHLSLLLGVRDTRDPKPTLYPGFSSKVSAVFDIFGPTDLSAFPSLFDAICPALFGKQRADAKKEIEGASPIRFVDKTSAPVFIYQGLVDPLVDVKQSKNLEARYRALGLTVEAVYLDGVGHAVDPQNPKCVDAVERGIAFLKKVLTAPIR